METQDSKAVDVGIILVNYNSSTYTRKCLSTIREQTRKHDLSWQVVVVDNDSRQEEWSLLSSVESEFDHVRVVRSNLNLGFAGANMLGTQFVEARYFFFLNNDTELLNDVIGKLFDFMEVEPRAGVCTAQMFGGDHEFTKSFHYFPHIVESLFGVGFARMLMPGSYPGNRKAYDKPITVPYVTGAALFCRHTALAAVGGMDVTHFLYWEEQDLCLRIQKAGFTVHLVPDAHFLHFCGKSTDRTYAVDAEEMISMLHFLRKNYPLWHRAMLQLFYAFKHGRKIKRGMRSVRLGLFILKGAPLSASMRYQQRMAGPREPS